MNFIMLTFGLMSELNLINTKLGVFLGTLHFGGMFTVIIQKFGTKTTNGIILSSIMCAVWSLYGVAALLEYNSKNIFYNILDIVSKNFYGVFVSIYLFTI